MVALDPRAGGDPERHTPPWLSRAGAAATITRVSRCTATNICVLRRCILRSAQFASQKGQHLATETLTRQAVTPELDLDGLDSILGIHVGTLNTLLLSRLERHLESFKVTPKQVAILWLVNANPGVKQSDLSRFFKIERPTVHQFVRQLTMNGHLVSEPSKLDRRAGGLWITETGTATLTAAREIIFTDEAELLSPLTPAEREEIYRLTIKVYLSVPNRT